MPALCTTCFGTAHFITYLDSCYPLHTSCPSSQMFWVVLGALLHLTDETFEQNTMRCKQIDLHVNGRFKESLNCLLHERFWCYSTKTLHPLQLLINWSSFIGSEGRAALMSTTILPSVLYYFELCLYMYILLFR